MTSGGELVELYSDRAIRLIDARDGEARVLLSSAGVETELYCGADTSDYLAGLARALGAATTSELIAHGRSK